MLRARAPVARSVVCTFGAVQEQNERSATGASLRTFRHFPKLLLTAAAAALVLAALVSAFLAWQAVNAALTYSASRAVYNAERLIDRTAADLMKLDGLRLSSCDGPTIERLKDALYGAQAQIREIGLIRKGLLFCTNFGPTQIDLTPERKTFKPGVNIGVGPNAVVPNNTSLYVYSTRDEDFTINAVINPIMFAEFERDFNYAGYGRLQMRVNSNALDAKPAAPENLYSLGRLTVDPASGGVLTRTTQSQRFPLTAEITVPRAAFWEEFWAVAPQMLAVFGLLAVIGLLLLNAWLSRGGFELMRYTRALRGGQLRVFYQPIVDARSRNIVGLEALLRWQHPKSGLLRAAQFSDIFEEEMFAEPLTRFIITTAVADMKNLLALRPALWCSVNLSPVLLENNRLLDEVSAQIRSLPTHQLRLEMTERTNISELAEVTLRELRAHGVQIGLDDLGTGYSNLNQLQRMTYDFIKIDGMLVRDIQSVNNMSPVVSSLLALAAKLGTVVVAEGIETSLQADALTQHGAQMLQGYFFSPARPAIEIVSLLEAETATAQR
jgi:sensor c-di-GMP phosphodiesterase-like protein